jgi:hypothetical protein
MMTNAQAITSLVIRAQAGDAEAYDRIVRRFPDMAVGYAMSLLGDFHCYGPFNDLVRFRSLIPNPTIAN